MCTKYSSVLLNNAFIVERPDGSVVGYNCTIEKQGNKLKVKANERQITNLHCNLKHPFTVVFDKVDKVLEANYLGWAFGTDIYQ